MSTNPTFDGLKALAHMASELTFEKAWDFIIHAPSNYETWWLNLLRDSPQHVLIETSLILFILWLVFIRRTVDPKKVAATPKLSAKEVEWLINTWEPEPLVPKVSDTDKLLVESMKIIDDHQGDYLVVRGIGRKVLNVTSFDFLGFGQDEQIRQVAREALDRYGCGSCGPRGFYGTIDQHLILEQAVSDFMGTQESICYSDGASATTSAIQAFSKKGDLLIVDEACGEPIMTGVALSRSTVKYFKHNDMDDLRRLLVAISQEDRKNRRDTSQQRRFIVVEGVFRSSGQVCPLPALLSLKEEFFYRLIVDETLSFGVLGKTGRGVTEHYGVERGEVEIITVTLDTFLASAGGLCIGSREIVEHQRLSGAGYCFSASSAPFLCAAAVRGLKKLEEEGETLLSPLRAATLSLRAALQGLPYFQLVSSEASPVQHVALGERYAHLERDEQLRLLHRISLLCFEAGVGIVNSKYHTKYSSLSPTLMIVARSSLTGERVSSIAKTLGQVARSVLGGK